MVAQPAASLEALTPALQSAAPPVEASLPTAAVMEEGAERVGLPLAPAVPAQAAVVRTARVQVRLRAVLAVQCSGPLEASPVLMVQGQSAAWLVSARSIFGRAVSPPVPVPVMRGVMVPAFAEALKVERTALLRSAINPAGLVPVQFDLVVPAASPVPAEAAGLDWTFRLYLPAARALSL